MANISINELRDDILDRMDNSVVGEVLSEQLRQKLKSPKRIGRAIDRSVSIFAKDSDSASLKNLQKIVELTADSTVGTGGVVNSVVSYLWPEDAYSVRENGGLLKVILDESEHYFDPEHNTPIGSVRFQANNSLYGYTQDVFHVDIESKRIYVPDGVTVSALIIERPLSLAYSSGSLTYDGATTLPLDEIYIQTLTGLALDELVNMGRNNENRQRTVNEDVSNEE